MSEVDQFLGAIQSTGLTPPIDSISDGKIHRFASSGKHGDDAGWYVHHGNGIQTGAFGEPVEQVSGAVPGRLARIDPRLSTIH